MNTYIKLCVATKTNGQYCTRQGSHKLNHNPIFCWQHQSQSILPNQSIIPPIQLPSVPIQSPTLPTQLSTLPTQLPTSPYVNKFISTFLVPPSQYITKYTIPVFAIRLKILLNYIHPNCQFSKVGLNLIDQLCQLTFEMLTEDLPLITPEIIKNRVIDTLSGQLSTHAIEEGDKALKTKGINLTFTSTPIQKLITETHIQLDDECIWYLTGVIEYLTAEILELSGNQAINNFKVRIQPEHIKFAITHDIELNVVLGQFFN